VQETKIYEGIPILMDIFTLKNIVASIYEEVEQAEAGGGV